MTPKDVKPLPSSAALLTEVAGLRRQLWQMIAASKKVLWLIPDRERMEFLDALIEAEGKLR